MRLKVSNVCQLLDKSKYHATQTTNGVTFTNNGDGTFTVNGTATNNTYFDIHGGQLVCTPNKKYLLCGCPTGGSWVTFNLYISQASDKGWLSDSADFGNGNVFTGVANATRFGGVIIFIVKNQTVNNLAFKPQLFDLTEMYGAGNEPTTVAQFRQDFPNEMYEYSPECWKKFRRLKYVTETKNLFDINKVVETVYVKRSGDGLICSLYGAPIGTLGTICPSLKVGDTVTVSFKTVSEGVKASFIQTDKHILINGEKFTVSETGLTSQFYLYNTSYEYRDIPNKTTYYELQLELGSTATPYQPYGYLPLNRGKYIANKEPVQLLDKTKYPATQTVNGITWTNNGDWTITANGTTNEVYVSYIIPMPQFKEVKNDHKYVLFSGINDMSVASLFECIFFLGRQDGSYFYQVCVETNRAGSFGFTIPQGEYPLWQRVELRVRRGYTANDLTFKPQLFDLTAMYGAGNEPTTVAQFRADYPNELYDYNPYNAITFR